jgi:hypothetical protein
LGEQARATEDFLYTIDEYDQLYLATEKLN